MNSLTAMLSPSQKEKTAEAVLKLHAAILEINDYREFPIIIESIIKQLFPIDWMGVGIFCESKEDYNVVTNPALPFDWHKNYIEIYEIDRIRKVTHSLPVGGSYIYHQAPNPNSDTEKQLLEIIKKHTDTSQFLTMHCAKTDAFDSSMGIYRTDDKFGFTRDDKEILDYLSPVIVSITHTMILHSELDFKRAALDNLFNIHPTLSIIFNDRLALVEIPLETEKFLNRHLSGGSRHAIPAPIRKWIKTVIAPEGYLQPNTGPWEMALSLPDMELVCKAYAIVTEMNQLALLVRLFPHHRSMEFDPLAAEGLTPKEIEAISYLPLGYSNKQIAIAMGIKEVTAKKHLKNAALKLEAKGRTETLYQAIKKKELCTSKQL